MFETLGVRRQDFDGPAGERLECASIEPVQADQYRYLPSQCFSDHGPEAAAFGLVPAELVDDHDVGRKGQTRGDELDRRLQRARI